jgi:hypothetical protein
MVPERERLHADRAASRHCSFGDALEAILELSCLPHGAYRADHGALAAQGVRWPGPAIARHAPLDLLDVVGRYPTAGDRGAASIASSEPSRDPIPKPIPGGRAAEVDRGSGNEAPLVSRAAPAFFASASLRRRRGRARRCALGRAGCRGRHHPRRRAMREGPPLGSAPPGNPSRRASSCRTRSQTVASDCHEAQEGRAFATGADAPVSPRYSASGASTAFRRAPCARSPEKAGDPPPAQPE